MLKTNHLFIQSIILLVVVSECVFCEKYNIGDMHRRYDLQPSVNTELYKISSMVNRSSIINTKSFKSGYNGSALIEEVLNKPRLANSKHAEKTQKHGSSFGQDQGQKKKKSQRRQEGLVQKILPLMIIPFMISTALIPIMLFVIKLLFAKAVFVAKIAVTLGLISFFKRKSNHGGVYNYNAWKMR